MQVLREWQAACHAAGFVGRAWPSEFGGGGRPPVEQIVVDQELAAAGAPEFVNVVGLDVLGPSLLRFGNDEQRRRYIPSILSAEEIWCQGFSEPEAGSDLASLRTRATRGRRPLRPQRPEDVGLVGPVRALVRRARAHRGGRPAPRGHLDADRRHALAGRRGAPDDADHRPRRVLRALPRRRDRPQGEPARASAATAGRSPCTRSATSAARPRSPPGQAAHVARPRRADAAGARSRPAAARRPAGAGRARAGADRRRGAAPPRLPDRRRVPQRRRRRPGQLEREAADGRGRAAARRDRVRDPRADAAARRPGGAAEDEFWTRPTCTRAPRASTAARSRSSATSSPTASSRCPRSRPWTSN